MFYCLYIICIIQPGTLHYAFFFSFSLMHSFRCNLYRHSSFICYQEPEGLQVTISNLVWDNRSQSMEMHHINKSREIPSNRVIRDIVHFWVKILRRRINLYTCKVHISFNAHLDYGMHRGKNSGDVFLEWSIHFFFYLLIWLVKPAFVLFT
jgi:hypothetical protein